MKLDPQSLRLFISVLEEGTIAAASQREHIAAAAVSRRRSELESLLGSQLLIRSNKGIEPTEAGTALMYMARGVLNDLSGIVSEMQEYSHGKRGSVRLLANISAITQFLPALLKSFMEKHPNIRVTLEQMESLAITRSVAESRADIGLFTRMPHEASVEIHPFRTDELVVLLQADHPLADRASVCFDEVLDFDVVSLHSGTHLHYQMLQAANESGRTFSPRMEVSSYDALCLMVQTGMGIGILPKGSTSAYSMPEMKILRLDEPWAQRELSMCVRNVETLTPAARLLFDHLQREQSAETPAVNGTAATSS